MKLLNKRVEMIALYPLKGDPQPIKFRYETPDGMVTVKIEKVVESRREKSSALGETIIYRCQSKKGDRVIVFELLFVISQMSWLLYKA